MHLQVVAYQLTNLLLMQLDKFNNEMLSSVKQVNIHRMTIARTINGVQQSGNAQICQI